MTMTNGKIELTDYERGFLEGLIDGEGSIHMCKVKKNHPYILKRGEHKGETKVYHRLSYQCGMTIMNENKELLQKAQKMIGGVITMRFTKLNRPIYRHYFTSNPLRNILPIIKLVCKERQRILMLEALDILAQPRNINTKIYAPRSAENTKKLDDIWWKMRRLNNKYDSEERLHESLNTPVSTYSKD